MLKLVALLFPDEDFLYVPIIFHIHFVIDLTNKDKIEVYKTWNWVLYIITYKSRSFGQNLTNIFFTLFEEGV
jgi:hypothetical protein